MKRVAIVVLGLMTVGLLITSCGMETNNNPLWTIEKSPNTGKCYELRQTYPNNRAGTTAMAEISCDYLR